MSEPITYDNPGPCKPCDCPFAFVHGHGHWPKELFIGRDWMRDRTLPIPVKVPDLGDSPVPSKPR